MADKYWVGGTGNWGSGGSAFWSLTSGGTGGAGAPSPTEDAYFDANSGGGICTISSANQGALNLSFTGFSGTSNYGGTLTQSGLGSLQVYGNITYSPSMTMLPLNLTLLGIGTHTITTNGIFDILTNYINILTIAGAGTTVYTLVGKLYAASISHTWGTFNTGNYDIACGSFVGSLANAKFLNLGSSTIFIGGSGASTYLPQNTTINAGTSTIKFINTANTNISLATGGYPYYNIWFDRGASTGINALTTSSGGTTFSGSFIDTGTAAHTITFQTLRTWIFGDFRVRGSAGNIINIQSNSGTSAASFSKNPLGLISCDYIAVTLINANPLTNTWYAGANSTLTSTTGWIATPPPPRKLGASGAG